MGVRLQEGHCQFEKVGFYVSNYTCMLCYTTAQVTSLLLLALLFCRKESFIIFQGSLIRACNLAWMMVSVTVTLFVMFSAYTTTGGELTPKKVFTSLSLLLLLRLTTIYALSHSVLTLSDAKVGIDRIQVSSLY